MNPSRTINILDSAINRLSQFNQDAKQNYDRKGFQKAIITTLQALLHTQAEEGGSRKAVMVYADFDPDGYFSGIVVSLFLKRLMEFIGGTGDEIGLVFSNPSNGFGITEEEFKKFSEEYRLVITVDNGSEKKFLDNGGAIVIDHHPTERNLPHIINPNAGRGPKETPYSTSAGVVAYSFIDSLDKTLQSAKTDILRPYREKDSSRFMSIMQAYASITVVSDMAVLDKDHRAFVTEGLRTMKRESNMVPLFEHLGKAGGFSSRSLSFNIISQINGWRRMGKNLGEIVGWAAPDTFDEFMFNHKAVLRNNEEKKKEVSMTLGGAEPKSRGALMYWVEEGLLKGLTGLVANRFSSSSQGETAIVVSLLEDTDNNISAYLSARGENAYKAMSLLFKEIRGGGYGGHPEACGGHISSEVMASLSLGESIGEIKEGIYGILDGVASALKVSEGQSLEVLTKEPVSIKEFLRIQEHYALRSGGVDYHKPIFVAVKDIVGGGKKIYDSGWGKIRLRDREDLSSSLSLLVDTAEFKYDEMISPDNVLIFQLSSSKDLVLSQILSEPMFKKVSEGISIKDEVKKNKEKPRRILNIGEPSNPLEEKNTPEYEFFDGLNVQAVRSNPNKVFLVEYRLNRNDRSIENLLVLSNVIPLPLEMLTVTTGPRPVPISDSANGDRMAEEVIDKLLTSMHNGKTVMLPRGGVSSELKRTAPRTYNKIMENIGEKIAPEYLEIIKKQDRVGARRKESIKNANQPHK